MADEKSTPTHHVDYSDSAPAERAVIVGEAVLPRGWKYRSFRVGPLQLPWYASPEVQITLVALVCFLCPGMFNAVNGLGGGGQLTAHVGDASNTAVYATFTVVGFFAGTIVNRIGVRYSLAVSGIGYVVYVSGYLVYDYTKNFGYLVFAGFLLGCCAGVLWSAQAVVMLSYPPESHKGRYIAYFWIIFNFGGVIGALVPLGQNLHAKYAGGVSPGTYIGFMVLCFCGALLGLTLARAKDVIRRDGSKVILMKNPTWQSEFKGLFQTLKSDPYIVFLFPMFFASNWFYTYQFNNVNGAKFDVRTRALNNVLYWTSQMIGATIFGFFLDFARLRRTTRAKIAWVALFVITFAIWGGGYAWQKGYTRANPGLIWDWTDSGYVGPMFLYMFYGGYDAAWQTCVYWFLGAITNNGRKLANFAGFYKGIQSAGAAIIWGLDGQAPPPFINEFVSCWVLLAAGLLFALPVVLLKIKDTVPVEEDLKFSDETVDEILGHQRDHEPQTERLGFHVEEPVQQVAYDLKV